MFKIKAFTLVELLVVIAVVGLLSTVVLVITQGVGEQGRIAKGLQFSQHLENSLGAYLVGRWNFDEGSGSTAKDSSGWENDGSLINSPVWRCTSTDTSSGQGCSLEFNGSTQYFNAGNDASFNITNAITLEIWFKSNNAGSTSRLISKQCVDTSELTADSCFQLGHYQTNFRFSLYTDQDSIDRRVGTPVTGVWYHFVGTWDGFKYYMYVNGQQIDSGSLIGTLKTNSNTPLTIATSYGNGPDYFFGGFIDEVRIYDRSLTSAQIKSRYYTGWYKLLAKGSINKEEYQKGLF